MDAACWLLDQGTPPADITWIRPRDSWILNRKYFQPGAGVVPTFEGVVLELEAVVDCDSIEQVYERLEEQQVVFRIDPSVQPSMLKGATASLGEVDQLRRIDNVVRLGHVERIDRTAITLEHGSVPTSPDHLHIHCASAGLSDNPPKPIFADDKIVLQPVTRVSLSLSTALIAFVEATGRSTADKNRLCPPNPWPHTPFDWARHLLTGMRTELEWQSIPDLMAWLEASRLNLVKGLDQDPDQATVADLQGRFLTALFPALTKLDEFATHASPAERARIFDPPGATADRDQRGLDEAPAVVPPARRHSAARGAEERATRSAPCRRAIPASEGEETLRAVNILVRAGLLAVVESDGVAFEKGRVVVSEGRFDSVGSTGRPRADDDTFTVFFATEFGAADRDIALGCCRPECG